MEKTFLQHTEARTKLQPFPLVEAWVWEGAEAVWVCYQEGKKSLWELRLLFAVKAAEQQRRNRLKPLTLVSQEASWGEGIEKAAVAAAEALSLHFFSLWEKAADFRVWTKRTESSPPLLWEGKCLTVKTTAVPPLVTISLPITLLSDGGLGKCWDDSQEPIQQRLYCLCMFLPTQVYTGQENLSTKISLPHLKHRLLHILSIATESEEKWTKTRPTHSNLTGDRGLTKGCSLGNLPLK